MVAKKYEWKVKKIKIDNIDLAIETYYPLVYSEFFSGTRKFDGRRFGKKIEDSAGPEVVRRILGGGDSYFAAPVRGSGSKTFHNAPQCV